MIALTHLTPDQYPRQPWKNGRGETREIAVDGEAPFRWRLSWARLAESGPFSSFDGYDRVLVLLDGGPLFLSHGKAEKTVHAMSACPFKGEWPTTARLVQPGDDFNAFALRGKAQVGVYPTFFSAGEQQQFPLGGREHFLFGVEGEIEIHEPNTGRTLRLARHQTLRVSRPDDAEYLNLRARAGSKSSCLWVVIRLM